jgi:hypothetical protein
MRRRKVYFNNAATTRGDLTAENGGGIFQTIRGDLMSDTDIDYSDNEFEGDDEVLEVNEEDRHEDKDEELQLAKQYGREGKYHALVGGALNAAALNDNVVTSNPDDHAPDNTGRPSRANVKPKKAKEQRLAARADAMKEWGTKLKEDEGMRVASGFKPKGNAVQPIAEESAKAEPWYVKEAIERGNIKGDKSRLNETLYQFHNDFNGVVDAFGIRAANVDHGIQKDSNGKIVFIGAMTLDRKQRAMPREDGQEENASENRARVLTAVRDGVAMPVTTTGAVDNAGYNAARGDLLLAERITDTKFRVEEVAVFVGPLLPELLKAAFENASATEIGESLGFVQPQASAVGNAMLQRALEAAAGAYARIKRRERGELTYAEWLETQPDGMPIPARKAKRAFSIMVGKPANDNLSLTLSNATTKSAA